MRWSIAYRFPARIAHCRGKAMRYGPTAKGTRHFTLPNSHMPTWPKRLLPVMSLLALFGCSGTSKDLPAKLTDLRVKVEMTDLTSRTGSSDFSHRSVRVVLSNSKGADLERADVGVELNGVPMEFRVGTGNYYDRHPYYRLDDDPRVPIAAGTDYRFVLILPDGKRHDIGTLRTPAALAPEQIDFAKKPPASGPVTIGWRELAEAAELILYRSEIRPGPEGATIVEGSSANDPEAVRRTIGPGLLRGRSGSFVLPAKLLASTPERKLLTIGADIVVVSEGRVSSTFSRQSTLRAERRIQLDMEFAEVK